MSRKILPLLVFLVLARSLSAQVQVNVTILSGSALTDCEDLIGESDQVWSVNINNQGWFDYIQDSNCPIFYSTPNLQFITSYGCPLDAQNELELCFRAYENDPGLLTPCNVSPDNCIEEVCARFPIPATGNAATYTLSLPNEGDARGQVEFQIETIGNFPGGLNDVPCNAIDLGLLPSGGKIGDATQGQYNNYCGTVSQGEPNPAISLAPWENDNGVWYSFITSNQPTQKIIVRGKSDPENTGDAVFLQIGLFDNPAQDCNAPFRYLVGSGVTSSDFQFDETVIFQCDTRLLPNTRYYILIDGVTRPPDDSYGVFGLEIENIPFQPTLVQDTICAGEVFSEFGRNHSTSGIYLDTLSLPNGCDSLIELRLTVLDTLQAQINQTRLADAPGLANAVADVTITGGSGNYAVIWSDGAIGNQRSDLVGGATYDITITDEYGCTVMLSLVTAYSNLILATASNDTLDCYGDQDGRIILKATNGSAPYRFQWQQIGSTSLNGVGMINEVGGFAGINNLPVGVYQITFLDSINGNVQLQAQVVSPDTLSFAILNQRNPSCYEACDAELSFEIRGGTPPYLYDFDAERFDTLRQRLSGLCAGSFTSIITDAKACSSVFSTVIQQPEALQIKVSNLDTVSCFGGNDGAIAVTAEDTENFVWSNGVSTPQINGLNAGDYTVTATSNNQCSDTLTITVPEPLAALSVQIVLAQVLSCFNGNDAQLTTNIQGEYKQINYKWSNGSQENIAKGLSAGTYTLVVENEKGCIASDTITLAQPDELSFAIASQDLSCGETGLLGAISIEKVEGGTPTYRFSLDGVRFTPNTMFDNLPEGTYEVIVQDENGCEQSQVVTILGTSYLSLSLGEDRIINFGDSILLQAFTNSNNTIFQWQKNDTLLCLGCTDLTIQPTRTEDYFVTAIDTITECSTSDFITIAVNKTNPVYVPNAFSPNGDNINDLLTLAPNSAVRQIAAFYLFDRTGALVYEVTNRMPEEISTQGWDGIFNGNPAASGIYVYVLQVELIDGSILSLEGDVSLIR